MLSNCERENCEKKKREKTFLVRQVDFHFRFPSRTEKVAIDPRADLGISRGGGGADFQKILTFFVDLFL